MVERIVLVNGLPGSGKTTLAEVLAATLPAVPIGKDAIKEAIAAAVPAADPRTIGPAVGELMWTLAAAVPDTALLESWWFRPRDLPYVRAGLEHCGSPTVFEIWCDVPPELARERYAARRRGALHEDARQLVESWPRWVVEAEPLGVGRTIRIPTDRPVDVPGLARRIDGGPSD